MVLISMIQGIIKVLFYFNFGCIKDFKEDDIGDNFNSNITGLIFN